MVSRAGKERKRKNLTSNNGHKMCCDMCQNVHHGDEECLKYNTNTAKAISSTKIQIMCVGRSHLTKKLYFWASQTREDAENETRKSQDEHTTHCTVSEHSHAGNIQ